jgi:serine-type D-Ala-D-Ala carboxypeptidase/endopeptidase (penicillin-binding protein 4)
MNFCWRWRVWGVCAVLLAHMAVAAQSPAKQAVRKNTQTLPPSVQQALKAARLPASAMTVLVAPVNAQGQPLLSIGAHRSLNPASVMKLVTTYAAIDLLGPEHRWQTGFYSNAVVQRGVLQGDLYVRGGGDPKWVLERIEAAFVDLQNQGVRAIAGDLVLDHSGFDVPPLNPVDFDGEHLRPYNVTPDALLVNFKSVLLHFTPDPAAGVVRVRSEPPLMGLRVDTTVALKRGRCADWRTGLRADFSDPNAIRLRGSYALGCGEQVWPVAYQDPMSYAARALEGLWRNGGGVLTGRVRSGITPTDARLILAADSLPLSDIIADVNQFSNNVMAQQVFLTLATAPTTPEMTQTTGRSAAPPVVAGFERSREVLARWWKQTFGSGVTPPVVDNGSGLSRQERITPDALLHLLRHAALHPQALPFVQSLSVAGVNGTTRRMAQRPNSLANGRAWIKTGTLRDVAGIAGYVDTRSGQRLVIIGFIHHERANQGRAALDALLEWAAGQRL